MMKETPSIMEKIGKGRPKEANDRGRILTLRVKGSCQWNVYDFRGLNEQDNLIKQKGEDR